MQNVSDEVRALVDRHAKITLFAYIDGVLVDADVGTAEYSPSCGNTQEFSFGNACAASIRLTLAAALPNIKSHSIRVTWAVDGTEYPLLSGKVEKATVSAGRTTVEAWDEIYYGGSRMFDAVSSTGADIAADVAFSEVAAAMGVKVDEESETLLSDIVISGGLAHLSGKYSNSAVAGYVASIAGGNALITRDGFLAVRRFARTEWLTEPYEGGAQADNEDFSVTGITFLRENTASSANADGTSVEESFDEIYEAGDGSLAIYNPLGSQEGANRAFAALRSVSFRPGSYTFPGMILIEPGDLFTVVSMDGTYTVAAVSITMSIDGGVKTTVACGGAVDDGGAAGAINQALKALAADVANIRTLIAENATIVSAKITNLSVEDLKAGKIRSTDFQTTELEYLYPSEDLYPADDLYPNNGDEIIRGLEIDFATGVIRGVFFNSVTDTLQAEVEALKASNAALEERLAALEKSWA